MKETGLFLVVLALYTCGEVDGDGDGYTVEAGDCNDADPAVYPGAPEACDGIDNNCNGGIDEGTACPPSP